MRTPSAILVTVILLTTGCGHSPPATPADLQAQVERQRQESANAVKRYVPKVTGQIGDLSTPATAILRQLPGVVEVQVLVSSPKPTHRIIHLADWHYVPKDLFALDLMNVDKSLTQARYYEFLSQVELVQLEQESIILCLQKHHGLHRVLYEGLTAPEVPLYNQKAAELREAAPAIEQQLREVQQLLKRLGAGKRYDQAKAVEKQVVALWEEYRIDVLKLGAPGRLAELEVGALDDADLLERAKPVTPEGKVKLDPAAMEARHEFQVRAAIKGGPVSVIILGGGHDLAPSVRRATTCEYLRVTTRRYREFAR